MLLTYVVAALVRSRVIFNTSSELERVLSTALSSVLDAAYEQSQCNVHTYTHATVCSCAQHILYNVINTCTLCAHHQRHVVHLLQPECCRCPWQAVPLQSRWLQYLQTAGSLLVLLPALWPGGHRQTVPARKTYTCTLLVTTSSESTTEV